MAPLSVEEGLSKALILDADFQANTRADTITPTTTAMARSSKTVTIVTKAKAIASGTKAKATVRPAKISILNKEKEGPSLGM